MASIADLNENYPDGDTDTGAILDDDARNTKVELLATFPNIAGAVTATHTELNHLSGAASIQPQLTSISASATTLEDKAYFYSGVVTDSGSLVPNPYFSWDVWHPATGEYHITHNLGKQVIPYICIRTANGLVAVESVTNKFVVYTSALVQSSVSARTPVDRTFDFIVATED